MKQKVTRLLLFVFLNYINGVKQMKKLLAVVVLGFAFTTTAYAGGKHHQKPVVNKGGNSHAISKSLNINVNKAKAKATARQNQKQAQGQVQGQKQTTQNSNNAKQNTTVGGTNFEAAASSAIASSMSPSAQCMGVATGGAQGIGFGISVGKSYESTECNKRELVRVLHTLGQDVAAIEVACTLKGAGETTLCKTLASNSAEEIQAFTPTTSPYSVVVNPERKKCGQKS